MLYNVNFQTQLFSYVNSDNKGSGTEALPKQRMPQYSGLRSCRVFWNFLVHFSSHLVRIFVVYPQTLLAYFAEMCMKSSIKVG